MTEVVAKQSAAAAATSTGTGSPAATAATTPDKMHGSYHWQFERLLSVATVPLCTVPIFTGPSHTADFLLGFVIPLHCHLGFGQIVTDYLNVRKIGVLGNRLVMAGLYGATALSIYGLFQFNTKDVGITEFVRNLWTADKTAAKKSAATEKP
jgi:succinate dehydrogenase (ubiquinone) membrane anchor subunit